MSKINSNKKDEKREFALNLLNQAHKRLNRLPKKDDFELEEVRFIKQKLGPWPRALEAAGLKEPPAVSAKEKNRIKRERARQRKKQALKEKTDKK